MIFEQAVRHFIFVYFSKPFTCLTETISRPKPVCVHRSFLANLHDATNNFDLREKIVALEAQIADLLAAGPSTTTVAATPSRTIPATMSSLIGVDNFLTASDALTPDQLEFASNSMFSTEVRSTMKTADKARLVANFIKGTTSKLMAHSTLAGLDNITSINNLVGFSVQCRKLEKLISAISAHDVFHVLKFDSDGEPIDPDTDAGKPVNLLSCTILPSLSNVEASTCFYSKRGTTFQ